MSEKSKERRESGLCSKPAWLFLLFLFFLMFYFQRNQYDSQNNDTELIKYDAKTVFGREESKKKFSTGTKT